MSNSPLARDAGSVVNCFAVHRARGSITLRASRAFADLVRAAVEQRAPGFGGVVFQEVGRGWYELVSVDTLTVHPSHDLVDEATAQLFLEYAHIALLEMMSGLDSSVAVVTSDVRSEKTLREMRSLRVQGQLSSQKVKPALTDQAWRRLENFSHSQRIARMHRGAPR